MSASSWTIRQLRELAQKRLGALAARLKTRDELYQALARHAPDALGLPAFRAEPLPGDAAAAPPAPAAAAERAAPVGPGNPAPAATAERAASVGPGNPAPAAPPRPPPAPDRVVVRDFFLRPGERRLPASYGDDRVLVFPRDPGGAWVSWDFRPDTWGAGAHRLVLRTADGRVLWSADADAPSGGAVAAGALEGEVVRALVLAEDGRELAGSAAIALPGAAAGAASGPRAWVRVEPGQPLPGAPRWMSALEDAGGEGAPRPGAAGPGPTSRTPGAGGPGGAGARSAHSRAGPHSRAR